MSAVPPGRPDHPDFWVLARLVNEHDNQADGGRPVEDIVGDYIDIKSLQYVAEQRALRACSHMGISDPSVMAMIAGAWFDAFTVGVAFRKDQADRFLAGRRGEGKRDTE